MINLFKSRKPSEFLTDYPGELYCDNVRWDENEGFGKIHPLKIWWIFKFYRSLFSVLV